VREAALVREDEQRGRQDDHRQAIDQRRDAIGDEPSPAGRRGALPPTPPLPPGR
jgi:hypothetical protein